ncbi:MAG: hypothetical protein CM1200mP40_18240 [Gammaproteobacteria bacterium]|nr:MAG: hypothetical protein CM1200mP40_18240 [Gammaproteobacteria bacterium]
MSVETPLSIAVVTVSDTRTEETDKSGSALIGFLQEAGHKLHSKIIVKDEIKDLRSLVSTHISDPEVHAVLTTGGTGFTKRDNTQEAIQPLFETDIDGFGNYFANYLMKKLVVRQSNPGFSLGWLMAQSFSAYRARLEHAPRAGIK